MGTPAPLSTEGFPMLSLIVSHTYTTIHILPMSSAFLSWPLVRLASCLKAGNCSIAISLSSLVKVNFDSKYLEQHIYLDTTEPLHESDKLYFCTQNTQHIRWSVLSVILPLSPSLILVWTVKPMWNPVWTHLLHWQQGLFMGFAHTARLSSILLSNPFLSATKGGPVRTTGKVTPLPGNHVAHHLFS